MKITYYFVAAAFLCFGVSAFAQHTNQFDDGLGDYSTLKGSSTGGIYTLPAGGGALVTTTSPGSIPLGGIIMWSGSIAAIPAGWALCDGAIHSGQPTPDLRNRFIVGAGVTYAVGGTGGSTNPTYTASGVITSSSNGTGISINNHTTGISINAATTGLTLGSSGPFNFANNDLSLSGALCSCGWNQTGFSGIFTNTFISSDPGHTHSITDPGHIHAITDPGHTHTFNASGISLSTPSNLPPYYALAYIMRVQ